MCLKGKIKINCTLIYTLDLVYHSVAIDHEYRWMLGQGSTGINKN